MRRLSLVLSLAMLLAFLLPLAAAGLAAERGHQHGDGGPHLVEFLMASTCPTCGNKGLAIGKDMYSHKIVYECRYGHRWTE